MLLHADLHVQNLHVFMFIGTLYVHVHVQVCTGVHNIHVYMCECFCCLSGLDVCTDITLDRKKWEDLFEQIRFFSLYK